jgi:hypothetical protein
VGIWDVIGMKAEFAYQILDCSGALMTPYGTTTFRPTGLINGDYGIEATDPLGVKSASTGQRLDWTFGAPVPIPRYTYGTGNVPDADCATALALTS